MARYAPKERAAEELGCTVLTIENWMSRGFIHGYRDAAKPRVVFVDLDEIERALKTQYPKMRDPRKRRGVKLIPVAVPIEGADQ
ncbi:hypothetical protein [Agromyces arachidis]|uniref:hypothetical protein n=1 Tax=Agromyces arachidis TaxID=766966 RepID=UPI004055B0B7